RFDEWSARGVELIFGKTALAFSAGLTLESPVLQATAIAFFALLGLGIVSGWISGWMSSRAGQMGGGERGSPSTLIAPLYFFVPLIVAFIVNPILPFFFERYVLVALPGFLLTAALGLEFLARKSNALAISALALLLVSNFQSLNNYYFDDAYAKGKYGQMMAYVSAHAQPGDALVLNNPLQKPLYRYYAPRDLPSFFLPDDAPLEDPSSRAQLEKITREHARVWLVMFGNPAEYDPTNYLQRTLGANAHKAFQQGFVDAALSLYLMPPENAPAFKSVNAALGEKIRLDGYRLDRTAAAPRDDLRLTLDWRADARIEKAYKVFVQIIGGYNPATQSPVWAQMDGAPVGGTFATTQWQTGETITDRYGLNLPENIPPGEYILQVGMYDAATGTRLPVIYADGVRDPDHRIVLTTIKVASR
ncbi:MAG: hypothetical protein HY327_04445, partial [Chloroflexi bacterium]|nr:hypothetical protein [Chloroflexota bacterium]